MFPRPQRLWLQGAVLAVLALLPPLPDSHAQAPDATVAEAGAPSVAKPEQPPRKSSAAVPPIPGQEVKHPGSKHAADGRLRVPPILIAFVLLFIITWVRAFLERRRLRADFRESCKPSPPIDI
jgi:hypothetical protein